MRRGNKSQLIENDAGEIYAIDLGADFCSEHEWGNQEMRNAMGIPSNQPRLGLDYHSAKVVAGNKLLAFVNKGNHYIIYNAIPSYYMEDVEKVKEYKKRFTAGGNRGELVLRDDWKTRVPDDLATAWDRREFGIVVSHTASNKVKDFGVKLCNAIASGDFSVWFDGSGGNPFQRSGLVVAVTSLVPQEVKDYMVEAYKEQKRLEEADEATGIKEYLNEKGKKYYACSPRFEKDGKSVIYWLNPQEQQIHDSGWFTVDELRAWADGKVGNKIDKVTEKNNVKV